MYINADAGEDKNGRILFGNFLVKLKILNIKNKLNLIRNPT